jgi:phage shock protein PspC (stress-responsive transcriptional regulator)
MNEIKKCSISGIAFTLELGAYTCLEAYLSSLKKAYADNPDCAEIIADIEARIAELILSAQSYPQQTVALPLIENIIAQLGSAEDISGEAQTEERISPEQRIPRRLYRDTEGAKLGGVCAGLGRYFNIDPSIIRLLFLVPLLVSLFVHNYSWLSMTAQNLFGLFSLLYIIMWFVVPAAQSARQKLEAEGNPVTAKTIADRQTATPEQRAQSSIASFVATLGRIAVVLIKVFVALLIFPLVMVCVSLLLCMVCIPFGVFTDHVQFGNLGSLTTLLSEFGYAFPLLGMAIVLIPTLILIYLFVVLLRGRRPRWWVLISSFVVWLILVFGTMLAGVESISSMQDSEITRILKTDADWDDLRENLERSAAGFDEPIDSLEYNRLLNASDAVNIDK